MFPLVTTSRVNEGCFFEPGVAGRVENEDRPPVLRFLDSQIESRRKRPGRPAACSTCRRSSSLSSTMDAVREVKG